MNFCKNCCNFLFVFHYIWSDYGDEIVVDKGTKLSKWTPVGRVSQKLNFIKDRGLYKKKERKKSHRRKYKSPPKSEDGGTGGEEAKSEKKLLSKEDFFSTLWLAVICNTGARVDPLFEQRAIGPDTHYLFR